MREVGLENIAGADIGPHLLDPRAIAGLAPFRLPIQQRGRRQFRWPRQPRGEGSEALGGGRAGPVMADEPEAGCAMVEAQHGVVQAEPRIGQARHAWMAGGDARRGDAKLVAQEPDGTADERQRCRARGARRTVPVQPGGEGNEGVAGTGGQVEDRDRIEAEIGDVGARIVRGRAVEKRHMRLAGAGGEAVDWVAPGEFGDQHRPSFRTKTWGDPSAPAFAWRQVRGWRGAVPEAPGNPPRGRRGRAPLSWRGTRPGRRLQGGKLPSSGRLPAPARRHPR